MNWSSRLAPSTPCPTEEVARALAHREPVVALESALITHGLPRPHNLTVSQEMEEQVRLAGATPATVAILGGQARLGLTPDQLAALAQQTEASKASLRDLPILALRGGHGGTTVAATAWLAARAGVRVFGTGGIGGVHRGGANDISADLPVLATTPLVVVCAGAKAILDLPRTWEWLETHSVPIVGYGVDEMPAFYSRGSGLPVTVRVDTAEEVARLAHQAWQMGLQGAVLVTVPIPQEEEMPWGQMEAEIARAVAEAEAAGVVGQAMTPFLLTRLAEQTGGESLRANRALLLQNAAVAAQIACCLAPLLAEPTRRRAPGQ